MNGEDDYYSTGDDDYYGTIVGHECTYRIISTIKYATCQELAEYEGKCTICGDIEIIYGTKTTTCLFTDKTLYSYATCSSYATYVEECFWCGDKEYSYGSEYDKNNHGAFGEWQYSCAYNGYKRKYCGCGEEYKSEAMSIEEALLVSHESLDTSNTTYDTTARLEGSFYCYFYQKCNACGKNVCVDSHKSVQVGRDLSNGAYMNWYCGTCGTWTGYWGYGTAYN